MAGGNGRSERLGGGGAGADEQAGAAAGMHPEIKRKRPYLPQFQHSLYQACGCLSLISGWTGPSNSLAQQEPGQSNARSCSNASAVRARPAL
eukprot:1583044-Rhodomonas_salina.1